MTNVIHLPTRALSIVDVGIASVFRAWERERRRRLNDPLFAFEDERRGGADLLLELMEEHHARFGHPDFHHGGAA